MSYGEIYYKKPKNGLDDKQFKCPEHSVVVNWGTPSVKHDDPAPTPQSKLTWRPEVAAPQLELSPKLIPVLRKHYCEYSALKYVFTKDNLEYLQGLYDGGLIEAKDLIRLINEHRSVVVEEKY